MERFSPETVLAAIAKHRVSVLPGVATIFRRLLDSPAFSGSNLSSLRLALAGAAPCPWNLAEEWRNRTSVRIVRGYGMKELFRPISFLADDPADVPESVGRALSGVELKVVDDRGALSRSVCSKRTNFPQGGGPLEFHASEIRSGRGAFRQIQRQQRNKIMIDMLS